ncbi:hypothetical protein HAX54_010153, partial [Datura stramonium]|nr:hypothetical protein [Datura stramonium]
QALEVHMSSQVSPGPSMALGVNYASQGGPLHGISTKKFKRFLKKEKDYAKKGTSSEKGSNEKSPAGCYKCYKTNHMIKDCPL